MATTINGYIADSVDNTDWVTQEEWESFESIVKKSGNMIIGRRTLEEMIKVDQFKGMEEVTILVLSSQGSTFKNIPDNVSVDNISPEDAIILLKNKGFNQIMVAGGGSLNASFLEKGLIDEIYIDIEAHILGKGIQLFQQGDFEYDLQLLEVKNLSKNTVQLHYKVLK